MKDSQKPLVSIVTPILNEEDNLEGYYGRLRVVLDSLSEKYRYEIVITDNCSTDRSGDIVKELHERDRNVRYFRFSRNFGYQKSIFTGYSKSKGGCVIEFDCDLQDPPELLPEMLKLWESGYRVVYGIREERSEHPLMSILRKAFYRLISKISSQDLPLDAGDFMLLDRSVVDYLSTIYDHNIYIRGEVFSAGFRRVGLPYSRAPRHTGSSKFKIGDLLSLALDGIVSQSKVPLRIATTIGIATVALTTILSIAYVVAKFFGLIDVEGFTTTSVLILLSTSINAILFGILGEYVGRIYDASTKKPLVIIEETTDEMK
jgi:glycosyltransferase involved in cell wall biosynthesis